MPKTKLTLSVDEALIRKAKRFSAQHNTTVSQLVTRFLASLIMGIHALHIKDEP